MLNKSQRLGRTDFTTFFKKGKRFHFDHLTIVYTPSPTFHGAVVVGKKVHKLAVSRNTIRRRIYSQLRSLLKDAHTGVFIVIVKPTYKTLTKAEAKEHLESLVGRIVKPA